MNRTTLIILLTTISLSCNTTANTQEEGNQPLERQKSNILFLLADDLGYGELGSYGQKIIQTPVLDSLAQVGMRFTNFYAGSPVCSPSRAVLMTGIKSSYSSIRGNKGLLEDGQWQRIALKKEEITLAELLSDAGYQTAFIGKWHLDHPDDLSTWAFNRGFQYAVQEQWTGGQRNFDGPMEYINGMRDSINFDYTQWNSHDEFRTELALEYLDNQLADDKPFFLFMSYRAPHGHEWDIGNQDLYSDQGWPPQERLHAAKITLLDQQIGRLLQKLRQMGKLENTLILFSSDNGPHHEGDNHDHEYFNSNGTLRGYKRDLYEGGVRVPMIAAWPGYIEAGSVSDDIAGFQDFMPTLAEIADVAVPGQSTGVSILPVLAGEQSEEREYMNWEFFKAGKEGFRQSVRIGPYKGVRYGTDLPTELYHLEEDISETNNIAAEHPEIVEQMNRVFEEDRTDTKGFPYGGEYESN